VEDAQKHIQAGAKRVIITAPAKVSAMEMSAPL